MPSSPGIHRPQDGARNAGPGTAPVGGRPGLRGGGARLADGDALPLAGAPGPRLRPAARQAPAGTLRLLPCHQIHVARRADRRHHRLPAPRAPAGPARGARRGRGQPGGGRPEPPGPLGAPLRPALPAARGADRSGLPARQGLRAGPRGGGNGAGSGGRGHRAGGRGLPGPARDRAGGHGQELARGTEIHAAQPYRLRGQPRPGRMVPVGRPAAAARRVAGRAAGDPDSGLHLAGTADRGKGRAGHPERVGLPGRRAADSPAGGHPDLVADPGPGPRRRRCGHRRDPGARPVRHGAGCGQPGLGGGDYRRGAEGDGDVLRHGGQRRAGMAVASGTGRVRGHRRDPDPPAGDRPPPHRAGGRRDVAERRWDRGVTRPGQAAARPRVPARGSGPAPPFISGC